MNPTDDYAPDVSESSGVTRREFVQRGAMAAAAAPFALGAFPAVASSAQVGGSDTLRVGLIGCGGRGTGAAMQALNADPGVRITALADVFRERCMSTRTHLANQAGDRVDVPDDHLFDGVDGYQDLIDSGVDVVLLATPPVFRPMHLAYAVDRGKHIFCEKPVAVDAPGIRSVLESATKANEMKLSLVCGFCWRYANHMRDTFAHLHDGGIGKIQCVQSTYNTGPLADVARKPEWSDMEWQLRNWKAFIWASGDHIVEQAVHAIDWIDWGFDGDVPENVYSVGGRIARTGEWTGNMYDHFSVIYEYSDGRRGYHMCRQIANTASDNDGHIIGQTGVCEVNPWARRCVVKGENPWGWRGKPNDMYQQEHDELFASIRSGKPMNDGEWMARTTMLGIIGREAAYTGNVITWDEMMKSEKSYTPESWDWGPRPTPTVPIPGQTKFT